MKEAGSAIDVIVALPATLFVATYGRLVPVSSVQVVPLVEAYTRSEPTLLPVELKTVAASKVSVPAFTPVKFMKKSAPVEALLSEVPVPRNVMSPAER